MKSVTQTLVKEPRELPLVTETTTEVDSETGLIVTVTRHRRGVLGHETREWEVTDKSDPKIFHAVMTHQPEGTLREQYEHFCDNLRKRLEESGLPTDQTPSWISVEGGLWRPRQKGEALLPKSKIASWTSRVQEMTEPESVLQHAAKLLEIYTALLKIDGIDEHLVLITRAINTGFNYRMASSYNKAATAGVKAALARAKGPSTRHERGTKVQAVVHQEVKAFWRSHPQMRNDVSNTAAHIVQSVNDEIANRKIGKGVKPKTIGDHIRAVSSEVLSELAIMDA